MPVEVHQKKKFIHAITCDNGDHNVSFPLQILAEVFQISGQLLF